MCGPKVNYFVTNNITSITSRVKGCELKSELYSNLFVLFLLSLHLSWQDYVSFKTSRFNLAHQYKNMFKRASCNEINENLTFWEFNI